MGRLGTSGFFHGGTELFLNGTLFMRVRCSGIRQWEPLCRSDFLQEFADWKAVYMRVSSQQAYATSNGSAKRSSASASSGVVSCAAFR